MTQPPASCLTPALVLELRGSIRWRINDGSVRPEPHILWGQSMETYILWTDGRPQCAHADIGVLGYLLRAERAEPGFVARMLDTTFDPETMSLEPVEREARQAAIREARALEKQRLLDEANERAERAARLRNVPKEDVGAIDLDTLL